MSLGRTLVLAGTAIALGVFGGCSTPTTKVDAQWVNPQFAGKDAVQGVMVMSVTRDSTARRIFEDAMVSSLSGRGVRAVQSYQYIPDENQVGEPVLKNAVQQAGMNEVMLTRVVNTTEEVHYSSGYTVFPQYGLGWGGFYGYYSGAWAGAYTVPATVYTTRLTYSDTRVYQVSDGVVIWSAATRTEGGHKNLREMINQFVSVIVDTMAQDGMIPAPPTPAKK